MKSIEMLKRLFSSLEKINKDKYNHAYEGITFIYDSKKYHSRLAKKTPNKKGFFVTFWLKNNDINIPYSISDDFDFLLVFIDDYKKGYFKFSKEDLIENKIISTIDQNGKMGFRLYPFFEDNYNKNALKSYNIQKKFFIELY